MVGWSQGLLRYKLVLCWPSLLQIGSAFSEDGKVEAFLLADVKRGAQSKLWTKQNPKVHLWLFAHLYLCNYHEWEAIVANDAIVRQVSANRDLLLLRWMLLEMVRQQAARGKSDQQISLNSSFFAVS